MFKNIILYPSGKGQLKKGLEKTPDILKLLISKEKQIYNSIITNNLFDDLFNLYSINSRINDTKINIGGDHSMSISTVQDSLNKNPETKVIWIDAHPDINTKLSSKTKNYHGMPLSILTGLDKNSPLIFQKHVLPFNNLLYIGIRDIDPFEKSIINTYSIQKITVDDLNYKEDMEDIKLKLNQFIGNSPVHLSFDVDCLDPYILPCTGTKVKKGLGLFYTRFVLDIILKHKVTSIDLTELNLSLGNIYDREKSLKNILFLFKDIIF